MSSRTCTVTECQARLTDQGSIMRLSNHEVELMTGLSSDEVQSVKDAIAVSLAPSKRHLTALDLYTTRDKSLQQWKLSTNCPRIDKLFRGGMPSGTISEVTGESASGKTQLCLQLCIGIQKNVEHGGGAVYICTEDAFPSRRLQEIIKHNSSSESDRKFGDHIFVEHVADFETLDSCVKYKLPVLLRQRSVRLVVIDSVTALFRCQYDVSQTVERAKHLNGFSSLLRRLAADHNIPIVCVNQVSSDMSQGNCSNAVTPALGLAWANQVTCRFMLSKPVPSVEHFLRESDNVRVKEASGLRTYRMLKVVFAPHLPQSETPVYIDRCGMHGILV
ncbi:DNA repair protein XRCC3 isoform X2 [Aplysia californica]|uniref:DNA repair protein XRCC3 isoform X2 n=1 Tax=Aplysia californica TaxID=6500 RepID=A0ABM1A9I5_APLCA|nr:DNA repair protein XRCC3 isoform X2 [Aplysia californica]